jgi:hypothetical protein
VTSRKLKVTHEVVDDSKVILLRLELYMVSLSSSLLMLCCIMVVVIINALTSLEV